MSSEGRLLRVNLTEQSYTFEDLEREALRQFIGGRGVGSKLLYEEQRPGVDPLSPENKLIFATGPLTATMVPSSGRYMVITRSPLTGAIACSNSGGYFPAEMRFAGIDYIILEGKAERPLYLWLRNAQVSFRQAEHLWGKDVHETEDLVRAETDPDAKVASIGPAGERGVLFSCIMNDKFRAAGRSGVGAVMGAKNLKAIAVRGTGGLRVADRDAFREITARALEKVRVTPATSERLRRYGTPGILALINKNGLFPTRNFRESVFEGAHLIDGERMARELLQRPKACFGCPIGCARVTRPIDPEEGFYEGPEYENIWALGAAAGVSDLRAISQGSFLCNKLGMDPISAGATVGCAMELFERGLISREEAGGELRFGDAEALLRSLKQAAYREGFGDRLALGSLRMASLYGHPELAMVAKGQEFPAYDGRGAQGMGLAYATSNRGACHLRGFTVGAEVFGTLTPGATDGKAELLASIQNRTAAVDSLGICLFVTNAYGPEVLAPMLSAVRGESWTGEGLLLAGERVWNLERLFNLREGFSRRDDTLPPRMLEEPIPAGPLKGQVCRLDEMLPAYYAARGWTPKGRPTPKKLRELDLKP